MGMCMVAESFASKKEDWDAKAFHKNDDDKSNFFQPLITAFDIDPKVTFAFPLIMIR